MNYSAKSVSARSIVAEAIGKLSIVGVGMKNHTRRRGKDV